MRVGMDRIWAFLLPSVIASLALVALLFVFYELLLRSPKMALLACALFFTNGGVGFLEFASELAREPALDTLLLPPREYTWSSRSAHPVDQHRLLGTPAAASASCWGFRSG